MSRCPLWEKYFPHADQVSKDTLQKIMEIQITRITRECHTKTSVSTTMQLALLSHTPSLSIFQTTLTLKTDTLNKQYPSYWILHVWILQTPLRRHPRNWYCSFWYYVWARKEVEYVLSLYKSVFCRMCNCSLKPTPWGNLSSGMTYQKASTAQSARIGKHNTR